MNNYNYDLRITGINLIKFDMKLFTLAFAGGSASYYLNWKPFLHKEIELIPLELAGRGGRIGESLNSDIDDMVEDVFRRIDKRKYNDYMFFGHSLGALLAFKLALKIKENDLPMPEHIFFSGRYSPNTYKSNEKILHTLSNEDFKMEILEMGGTSTEIFEHPELTNLFLPILRNDIKIAETYGFVDNSLSIDCDFSILTGKEENYSIEQIEGWRKLTSQNCSFYQFEGGHFFINEERAKIVGLINDTAAKCKKRKTTPFQKIVNLI